MAPEPPEMSTGRDDRNEAARNSIGSANGSARQKVIPLGAEPTGVRSIGAQPALYHNCHQPRGSS